MSEPLLEVSDLTISFSSEQGVYACVDELSFQVERGETFGIVGESGSGKTMSSLAIMGLLPKRAMVAGSIRFLGDELVTADPETVRALRGDRVSMIFQDALTALNPVMTIGRQINEMIRDRVAANAGARRARVLELLDLVGIPNPTQRIDQYPHEFSGGMRQRAMIAMAIANEPDLIIADEPTTALDVTVQAQVLEVLTRIQERTNSALILITHDLGVIAGIADRVMVMYAGADVEQSTVDELFESPAHPYSRGLLASLPRVDRRVDGERLARIPGNPPGIVLPPGCAFNPRCPDAVAGRCDQESPQRVVHPSGRSDRCLRRDELSPWPPEASV